VQQKVRVNKNANVNTSLPKLSLMKRLSGTIGRSTLLGFFVGVLPGIGATTAAMLSYSQAASTSKKSKDFGKGVPEGIAAPESANNSAAMGAMVPLLSLGIPGSATTAILLGAFILHGIQPGPLMFQSQGPLVYTIFIGLLIANIMIIFLSKPFIKIFSNVLRVPYSVVGPLILLFCVVGTFAVRNSLFDVAVMLAFGIFGYILDDAKFPLAPVVLGLVLGPIVEEQFRRAMLMSGNDFSIFFTRPISLILMVLTILSLLIPLISYIKKKRTSNTGDDQSNIA